MHTYVKLFAMSLGVCVCWCALCGVVNFMCAALVPEWWKWVFVCSRIGDWVRFFGWVRKREPHNVCFNNFILCSAWRRRKCTRHQIRTSQLERIPDICISVSVFSLPFSHRQTWNALIYWCLQNISSRLLLFFGVFLFAATTSEKSENSRCGKLRPNGCQCIWSMNQDNVERKMHSENTIIADMFRHTLSNAIESYANDGECHWFRVQRERRRQRLRRVSSMNM